MARKRKVSGVSDDIDIIVVGGIAIGGYFFVVKPLMSTFQTITPQQQAAITNQNALQPGQNALSYQYQGIANAYQTGQQMSLNNNGQTVTTDNNSDYFQLIKQFGDLEINDPNTYNGTLQPLEQNIYNQGELLNMSFKWYSTDQTSVDTVFNQFTSKKDVANVAAYLYYNYGLDLSGLLNNNSLIVPAFLSGLPQSDYANLILKINALP